MAARISNALVDEGCEHAYQVRHNNLAFSSVRRSGRDRGLLWLLLGAGGLLDTSGSGGAGSRATSSSATAGGLAALAKDLIERLGELVWHDDGCCDGNDVRVGVVGWIRLRDGRRLKGGRSSS